jgi:hypothetical protein
VTVNKVLKSVYAAVPALNEDRSSDSVGFVLRALRRLGFASASRSGETYTRGV